MASHTGFIVASYAAALVVIGGLVVWVVADYRTQLRRLADLEMRGLTRRSETGRGEGVMRQAKGDA
jgi:heme exporter protein D